jgi:hypothetical protein
MRLPCFFHFVTLYLEGIGSKCGRDAFLDFCNGMAISTYKESLKNTLKNIREKRSKVI